ncbi:hypothetical protein [Halosegnis rubeus]|uniref:Metal-dependent hydrolase n=1 Tax=Halosegnis rubeus TaxID=2212850 RepID=A0A5N5UMC8_9EURY|nr:hypothetical protein [Halosegnis rubeus]KAB7518493.1 hypothetical protein DMP03_03820 [Halosegnis rubeus]
MVTTLVTVATGLLVAAAVLDRFSLRVVALVAVAAALPDVDAVLAVLHPGLHNAALHNVWLPFIAGGLLTSRRVGLRERLGNDETRLAWAMVLAYTVAVAFDLFNVESAAVLWPLHDRFFAVYGQLAYSTTEGLRFTFFELQFGGGELLPKAGRGTVAGGYVVPSPFVTGDGRTMRAVLVNAGWELLVALVAVAVVGLRLVDQTRGES